MVIRTGAAIAQANHDAGPTGALPCPVSASVAHLNVNGTATVAILATSRSPIVTQTRSLRSRRSDGQMYGPSTTTVRTSLSAPSAEKSPFTPRAERGRKDVLRPANGPAPDRPHSS